MFKIGKLFHLAHVVSDLDTVDKWYDEIFSGRRFYRGYVKAAMREASLVILGDCVMEPIQLARVPGAEQSAIGKFYTRFGQHFHSIAWYVDSIEDTVKTLSQHNLRLYDLVGKTVQLPTRTEAVWTHPKETQALLEFAVGGEFSVNDVRLRPEWSSAFWRDQHPLGIERTSHITVLVRDLRVGLATYQTALGGTLLHEEESAGQQRSAFVAVGEDTVVELVQSLSTSSPEGVELAQNGEGVYALTFKTTNVQRAADFLQSEKQRVEWHGTESFALNKEDAFGMVMGFTQRRIPQDPR